MAMTEMLQRTIEHFNKSLNGDTLQINFTSSISSQAGLMLKCWKNSDLQLAAYQSYFTKCSLGCVSTRDVIGCGARNVFTVK